MIPGDVPDFVESGRWGSDVLKGMKEQTLNRKETMLELLGLGVLDTPLQGFR